MSDPGIRWNDLSPQLRPADEGPLPWLAGDYIMSVDLARWGLTRQGKRKISITLLCKSGLNAGHFYVWDLVRDPGNPDYFVSRLNTLGATSEFLDSNPSLDEICLQIIGATEYLVTFRDAMHNGRATTEISYLERA